jgi:hypothetical protein
MCIKYIQLTITTHSCVRCYVYHVVHVFLSQRLVVAVAQVCLRTAISSLCVVWAQMWSGGDWGKGVAGLYSWGLEEQPDCCGCVCVCVWRGGEGRCLIEAEALR